MSTPRGGRAFAGAACPAEPRCARSFFGKILCSAAGWGLHNGQFASPAGGHGQIVCNDVIGTLWRASPGHGGEAGSDGSGAFFERISNSARAPLPGSVQRRVTKLDTIEPAWHGPC
jgi:hypothetical protein